MSAPEPGKPFGPFLVDAAVGQGGMGAVHRARDAKLGRMIALKVMLPAEAADPESRARFVREARLAAQLEHPGIVRIYEVGEVDGTPYIAMEWIEGRTLRATKVDDRSRLLERIAETLAFAHSRGVVHRDLKPANVMIDAHGDPKLVDFGIAKRLAPSATFATQDGLVLGTPQYMAPEQMLSSAVDARADQYAWGVIAYELLTGERPLRPALAHAALDDHHGPIVLRALSDSPSDRFESMNALLEAWRARPQAATTAPVPAPAPRRRDGLWFFGAAAALVVLVGAASLGIQLTRPKPVVAPPPPPTLPPPPIASAETTAAPIASDEPLEPSGSAASASSKPNAGPAVARARGIADFAISAHHVYREDADQVRERLRAAYVKCIVGMPLRGKDATIKIIYRVMQPPTAGSVEVSSYGERNWPPIANAACLEKETLAVEVRPMPDATVGTVLINVLPR